jgi:glycerol-3-phosphate dehydrogenase
VFSNRNQLLESAKQRRFDVLVIGGGITGAGVALDAASRGLSVALLEKDDFASGTSSRTTKLIHGGLRYLEQFKFKLVSQLCAERALLERLAPHMVHDVSFVLPFPPRAVLFSIKALLGLTIYDFMSWSIRHRSHRRLSRKQVRDLCPLLSANVVSGGARFYDCQADDARLVLEVVKTAASLGATVLNYIEVEDFQIEDGKIAGVHCIDRSQGEKFSISGKSCINATGVWIDSSCRKLDPEWISCVTPSRGTHIVVPQSAFETSSGLLLPASDGRYIFVVPWQRAVMIGTTDQFYEGDLDQPLPTEQEIDYLLNQVNRYLNGRRLSKQDIIGCFAGLRPLIGQGQPAITSDISREHLVFDGPNGMIGIIGGKLTNFRLIAQEAVDKLLLHLEGQQFKESDTKNILLGGWHSAADYLTTSALVASRARQLSVEPATVDHLLATYGADADKILDVIEEDSDLNERICLDYPPILAEIRFCAEHEMVMSLEDMLMRRLRLGMLDQVQCLDCAPIVAELMGDALGWDQVRQKLELETFEKLLHLHLNQFRQLSDV